jgi:hypothetical protein
VLYIIRPPATFGASRRRPSNGGGLSTKQWRQIVVTTNRRPSDDTGQIVGDGCCLPWRFFRRAVVDQAMAADCRVNKSSPELAIDGRDRDGCLADKTGYSVKPSNRIVGTSIQSLVPSIDHDVEEDHHHELTAVRGQAIVVDETGGRSGSCSFVSYGITIVIVIFAMDCAVVGDGIVGRAFLLVLYDPS